MTTNILPVSEIINVTITDTPSGLTQKNVNSLAILTQDAPINLETYGIYISPAQAAANYGTDTLTAQMVSAVFAQRPNILSGDGRLVIIPMLSAVDATQGHFNTANISANIAALIAVTSGDIKFTVNSVAQNLTKLNFSTSTTFEDIAAVIQAKLIDAVAVGTSTGINIFSNKVGSTSTVTAAAVSGGTGTDLTGAGLLNTSAGAATGGANSSGETLLQCLARTTPLVSYTGFMSTLDVEDAIALTTANAVQALDNIYFEKGALTTDIAGIGTSISSAGDKKARLLVKTTSRLDATLYMAAYAGRGCSVDFTGSLTAQTMNLKQLAGILPDTGITQTLYAAAKVAGVDLYVSYDGVPSVLSTGGNDFFDNVYSDLALKFYMETAGFNYLRQTNTKVPQTEQGMNGLKAAYSKVCDQFVTAGFIAPNPWTSSETFGNPAIFDQNILDKGYYVYSIPIAQQNTVDREARKAPLVQIAIKRSGAIHTSDVIVLVND